MDCWIGNINNVPRILNDNQLDVINSRLETIKFPKSQLRLMPTFTTKSKITPKWKAIEYELFLTYGFLCLEDMLPRVYFNNFVKLVKIISTLTKRSISVKEDIIPTNRLITDFLREFHQIYSLYAHRFNVHLLTHMAEITFEFGPLYVSSSYIVENSIGLLVKKIKTSNLVQEQIINKILSSSSVLSSFLSDQTRFSELANNFILEMFPSLKKPNIQNIVIPSTSDTKVFLSPNEKTLLKEFQSSFSSAKFYQKILVKDFRITTDKYSSSFARANCFIKSENKFFKIIKIIFFEDINKLCFLGKRYEIEQENYLGLHYVHKTSNQRTIELVNPDQIQSNFTIFSSSLGAFILEITNRYI